MRRLERFHWIPMLLKAYSEARERMQEQQAGAGVSALSGPPPSTESTGATAKPKPAKARKLQNHRGKPKRAVRRLKRMPAGAGLRRVVRARRMTTMDYRAVLNELREAKQQLGQLDSIREQLNVMQQWFEERIPVAEKNASTHAEKPSQIARPPGLNPHPMQGEAAPAPGFARDDARRYPHPYGQGPPEGY